MQILKLALIGAAFGFATSADAAVTFNFQGVFDVVRGSNVAVGTPYQGSITYDPSAVPSVYGNNMVQYDSGAATMQVEMLGQEWSLQYVYVNVGQGFDTCLGGVSCFAIWFDAYAGDRSFLLQMKTSDPSLFSDSSLPPVWPSLSPFESATFTVGFYGHDEEQGFSSQVLAPTPPVPEPVSAALLLTGGAAVFLAARRRTSAQAK